MNYGSKVLFWEAGRPDGPPDGQGLEELGIKPTQPPTGFGLGLGLSLAICKEYNDEQKCANICQNNLKT